MKNATHMKHSLHRILAGSCMTAALIGALLTVSLFSPAQAGENNLNFSGALVSEPCDLDPQSQEISVDFGEVAKKYLYVNTRTNSKAFVIHLTNCDITLGSSVLVTFVGTESTALPGLLAVDTPMTGVAVGLEYPDGTPLLFNQASSGLPLVAGNNDLTFGAYIEGEPDAITNESIVSGSLAATAIFEMSYP